MVNTKLSKNYSLNGTKLQFEKEVDKDNTLEKCRTHNVRFGASGGVAPRKVQWEYERL